MVACREATQKMTEQVTEFGVSPSSSEDTVVQFATSKLWEEVQTETPNWESESGWEVFVSRKCLCVLLGPTGVTLCPG